MFGVFSRFFGHLWETVYTEREESLENFPREEFVDKNFQEYHRNSDTSDNTFSDIEHCALTLTTNGKVTKLYDDSGVINDEVYFHFDRVIGGVRPKLNAEVHVEATRSSVNDGWLAERVEVLLTEWNSSGEDCTTEVLVGEITDLTEQNFVVNADILCTFGSLAFGYVPSKGDWVRVEVVKEREVVCNVKSITPLRERTFCGCITSVNQGHGYINKDVFFSFGVCPRNYTPRRGHNVNVTAIESNQGRSRWRALKIVPQAPSKRETGIR